jgi:SAM-dependent methyltransferase
VVPVAARSYDVVLFLYVLHHAADEQPLLDEARRVLRDGGVLLIAEDCVDGVWNRILTVGFHVWLWLITRMGCDGRFRTTSQWQMHLHEAGFELVETTFLGHHLGRLLWPNNVLFVLQKEPGTGQRSPQL